MIDTLVILPEWVIGEVPPPYEAEMLRSYATRIGLDPEALFIELKEPIADMANLRLSETLRRNLPKVWSRYIKEHITDQLDPEQIRRLRTVRLLSFPDS